MPILFLQGARDDFAAPDLLQPLVKGLADRATLHLFPDADHSFHVPAHSGRKDADVLAELLDRIAEWIAQQGAGRSGGSRVHARRVRALLQGLRRGRSGSTN